MRKIKCYISKSKLILCEYNAFYFSEIAFIGFTLHEIKQGIVFLGHLVVLLNSLSLLNDECVKTHSFIHMGDKEKLLII